MFIGLGIFFIFCKCASPQDSVPNGFVCLELKLQGKQYSNLVLCTPYRVPEGWDMLKEFPGRSEDGYNWIFLVPDSIYDVSENFVIRVYPFDFENNRGKTVAFTIKDMPETKKQYTLILEEKKTVIEGVYRNEMEEYFSGFAYLFPDTFVESPTIIFDIFDLIPSKNEHKYTALELSLFYPDFSSLPEINYEEALQQRIALVKEYPNSNFLLNQFTYSTGYKNKKDMKLVFDHFSEKMKSSDLGKHIAEYLSKQIIAVDIFTEKLTNSKNNQSEPVITNQSKPTLVIFSASWCAPCHKLIPQLKEIYNELSPLINMVYISMDREKSVPSWKKLMTTERIPWRSLLAENKIDDFYETYSIDGIPYAMIVYDNNVIPVNPIGKEKLHEIISMITKK